MKQPQEFERDWWGDCGNTFGEETKQLVYASLMGIERSHDGSHSPYSFDMQGKKILDVGGGPVSLLLKCRNLGGGKVVDPCPYPEWTRDRYAAAGIAYARMPAEQMDESGWDEAWIYNVLQHVQDPEVIVRNARRAAKVVRLFEWVDVPPHEGHPHTLTAEALSKWLGGPGVSGELNGEGECYGRFYVNVR